MVVVSVPPTTVAVFYELPCNCIILVEFISFEIAVVFSVPIIAIKIRGIGRGEHAPRNVYEQ